MRFLRQRAEGGGRKLQGRQAGRALYFVVRERAEEGRIKLRVDKLRLPLFGNP